MIQIIVNKLSEFIWVRSIMEMGTLNPDERIMYKLKDKGIDINKTVNYKMSEDFENDLGDEYNELYHKICGM